MNNTATTSIMFDPDCEIKPGHGSSALNDMPGEKYRVGCAGDVMQMEFFF